MQSTEYLEFSVICLIRTSLPFEISRISKQEGAKKPKETPQEISMSCEDNRLNLPYRGLKKPTKEKKRREYYHDPCEI
ncbi:hypothetical protein EUGRSUZ_J00893 [Eucalyptus grandis]|uniref:Uncharacterized protein n=2 Tax=Eucalyptus grandis TaxID=71139 RepID=A0ACC3J3Y9_EUCGR|nr:hypothetical protein EUGRSUZ_J00893 [Eucalyptus grandis]